MLAELWPLFASVGLGCVAVIALGFKESRKSVFEPKPLSLGFAFEFALVFLLASVFLTPFFSTPGGWLAAFAGGLVNSTAVIAASALSFQKISGTALVLNVFFAMLGSTASKTVLIYRETRSKKALQPFALILAAGLLGVFLTGVV
jgi:hypothetical protein